MNGIFVVTKSNNKLKKWTVRKQLTEDTEATENNNKKIKYGKCIYFGAEGFRDYTIMHQPDYNLGSKEEPDYIKSLYLKRHAREDWNNLNNASAWATGLLWNKPTMEESARDMEQKFNIKIILKLNESK